MGLKLLRTSVPPAWSRPPLGFAYLRRFHSSPKWRELQYEIPKVAVLYQALKPPVINGIRKPPKPGGYQDSGADIAYILQTQARVDVATPATCPDPKADSGWCWGDTEEGIMGAVEDGATHLWANTILFGSHPLQTSSYLKKYQDRIRVVGQPPLLVEKFDDKQYLNDLLRGQGSFTMPEAWSVNSSQDMKSLLTSYNLPYPIVGKPVRGRGSHGVKVCYSEDELFHHVKSLLEESSVVMLEQFLSGEEATYTIMPPSPERPDYWAMPPVTRFNHEGGIAPYNGIIAVTANSKALTSKESAKDARYLEAAKECEAVARLLNTTAPIRIDVRRFTEAPKSKFALFDINMKPNMTGPGRPGRENQASLTAISAAILGWDYPKLLVQILNSASTLGELRAATPRIQ